MTPQKHPRHTLGLLEISLAGFCFGFLGVFGKLAYARGFTVGELLSCRFLMATAGLGLGLAVFSPKKLKVPLSQIPICAGLGILGYAVFSTLYFMAIKGVSVALASLLLYTFPVWVALGARFLFNERLTPTQWIALPLVAVGLIALLWRDLIANQSPDGVGTHARTIAILAGLGSALAYATYILASSKLQKNIEPLSSSFYVMLFASLGLIAFHRPDFSRWMNPELETVGIILGVAIVCTVAPLTLFLSGLQKLGNTEASLLSTVEPVTAALVGALILGEAMRVNEMLGGAIVLAALGFVILGSRRKVPVDF